MRILTLLAATGLLCSCDRHRPQETRHPLVGAWLANDGTIFHFRNDGSFHGIDWRKKEIWGNWVILSDSRIGFQSLLHDASYRPQYAVIRDQYPDRMDYIITDGTSFIAARRTDPAKAEAAIETAIQPGLHLPGKSEGE